MYQVSRWSLRRSVVDLFRTHPLGIGNLADPMLACLLVYF